MVGPLGRKTGRWKNGGVLGVFSTRAVPFARRTDAPWGLKILARCAFFATRAVPFAGRTDAPGHAIRGTPVMRDRRNQPPEAEHQRAEGPGVLQAKGNALVIGSPPRDSSCFHCHSPFGPTGQQLLCLNRSHGPDCKSVRKPSFSLPKSIATSSHRLQNQCRIHFIRPELLLSFPYCRVYLRSPIERLLC